VWYVRCTGGHSSGRHTAHQHRLSRVAPRVSLPRTCPELLHELKPPIQALLFQKVVVRHSRCKARIITRPKAVWFFRGAPTVRAEQCVANFISGDEVSQVLNMYLRLLRCVAACKGLEQRRSARNEEHQRLLISNFEKPSITAVKDCGFNRKHL